MRLCQAAITQMEAPPICPWQGSRLSCKLPHSARLALSRLDSCCSQMLTSSCCWQAHLRTLGPLLAGRGGGAGLVSSWSSLWPGWRQGCRRPGVAGPRCYRCDALPACVQVQLSDAGSRFKQHATLVEAARRHSRSSSAADQQALTSTDSRLAVSTSKHRPHLRQL